MRTAGRSPRVLASIGVTFVVLGLIQLFLLDTVDAAAYGTITGGIGAAVIALLLRWSHTRS